MTFLSEAEAGQALPVQRGSLDDSIELEGGIGSDGHRRECESDKVVKSCKKPGESRVTDLFGDAEEA